MSEKVLTHLLYTNDKPLDSETKRFIWADNRRVTSQHSTFTAVKKLLTNALNVLQHYYAECSPKAKPIKEPSALFPLQKQRSETPTEHDRAWKET